MSYLADASVFFCCLGARSQPYRGKPRLFPLAPASRQSQRLSPAGIRLGSCVPHVTGKKHKKCPKKGGPGGGSKKAKKRVKIEKCEKMRKMPKNGFRRAPYSNYRFFFRRCDITHFFSHISRLSEGGVQSSDTIFLYVRANRFEVRTKWKIDFRRLYIGGGQTSRNPRK